MGSVTVTVSGCRSGEGSLTWGQAAILRILTMLGERAPATNLAVSTMLPDGLDLAAAVSWIRELLETYDALRTRYVGRAGETVQVLDGAGTLEVEVVGTDGWTRDDIAGYVERLGRDPFDHAGRWPVRFAVLMRGDTAAGLAFACSHAMTDGWGLRPFQAVLGRPGARPDPGVQPLDQAAFEASPRGRAVDERAARYWRAQLTAMPPTLFSGPARPMHDGTRFWYAELDSPLAAAAVPHLAAHYRCTTSAVLHAAFQGVLAANAGVATGPMGLVAANRTRPGTRTALNPYSQLVPVTVAVTGKSWAARIRATADADLLAYRYGSYDPRTRDTVTAEVEQARGVPLDLSLWFNDTREAGPPPPLGFDPAVSRPGVPVWADRTDHGDSTVYVYVRGTQKHLDTLTMVDTTRLSLSDAENLLGDLERALADAAAEIGRPGHSTPPSSVRWNSTGHGQVAAGARTARG